MPCPYSGAEPGSDTAFSIRYSETSQAMPGIEDFEGLIDIDRATGVYYVNPRYDENEFADIYKSLSLKKGTLVKRLAAFPTRLLFKLTFSGHPVMRLLGNILKPVLIPLAHPPLPPRNFSQGRVLDVGCGDGFHLQCYGENNCELFGTEIHPGYAEILGHYEIPVKYWIKEFSKIDWESETGWESFDLIIFQSVFYRLNNPVAAHELAWKLLRPGGSILRIEPVCLDDEAMKFMARFNFPQGFTFIQDPEKYIDTIRRLSPGAEVNYELIYGRTMKHKTGREMNIIVGVFDIIRRLFCSLFRKEPWFIRLEINKPAQQ